LTDKLEPVGRLVGQKLSGGEARAPVPVGGGHSRFAPTKEEARQGRELSPLGEYQMSNARPRSGRRRRVRRTRERPQASRRVALESDLTGSDVKGKPGKEFCPAKRPRARRLPDVSTSGVQEVLAARRSG
jgi:hypothetical protein